MTSQLHNVVPKPQPITEAEFHAAMVAGIARVAGKIGRGNLADKWGKSFRQLTSVFAGGNTSDKGLLDFLRADPTALDEVLALYGFGLARLTASDGSGGGERVFDAMTLATEDMGNQKSGNTDHRAMMRLADMARPVVQAYSGIIADADRMRGLRVA